MQTEHHTQELIVQPVNVELADEAESREDLDAALAAARSEFERAEADAVEAEQRAVDAADAFSSDPTADAHGSAAALRQLAVNAGERARQSAKRAAELGAEQLRRQRVARLTELEPAASRDRLLSAVLEEATTLATDLHAKMAQLAKRLLADLEAHSTATREADRLASELGVSRRDRRPATLPELNQWLATQLAAAFPARRLRHPVWGHPVDGPAPFTVAFAGGGDGSVLVQIQAAAYVDPNEHGHSVAEYLGRDSAWDRERHRPTLAWDPDAGEFCVRRS